VPATPRLQAKADAERAERRATRLRRSLVAVVVAAGLAVLGWLVLVSSVLGVADVRVTGTSRLTPAEVERAAALAPGTPLARIRSGAVSARVRAALPLAGEVSVRRVWPRTVELQVAERTPAGAVVRPDGALLVSADGVGFATVPAPPAGVPKLELARPARDDPATRSSLAVLTQLPPALRQQVGLVRATTASDVQLVLSDGRTVVWGEPVDAAAKATELTALMKMPGTLFDVSAPGIVVRR
jgi:cell division protein FtsQ